ncbi:DNA-binding protein [Pyrococcus kukulkanii]|uniref:DNA-binding protein n=1 Tax=Pyrococcus kukulkanii TaxID=1609559 RepID=A0ABV4T5Y6_9EURY
MRLVDIALILLSLVFLALAYVTSNVEPVSIGEAEDGKLVEFTGVCVYSSDGFSILTDGKFSVPVFSDLKLRKVYKVIGVYRRNGIKPRKIEDGKIELEEYEGAYWVDYYPSLLTPKKIKLKFGLSGVEEGELVRVRGIFFGSKLVPVEYYVVGNLTSPKDGYPFKFRGVVLYGGNPGIIFWKNRSVKVYLKDNQTLIPGRVVEVFGITRITGKIIVYTSRLRYLGSANVSEKPNVGEIAEGECRIIQKLENRVKLECLDLPLSNVTGRVGDKIKFRALKRFSDYLCLNCTLYPRENLGNMICNPEAGKAGKVSGVVENVKEVRGRIIAQVRNGNCRILLKIKPDIRIEIGDKVEAFGVFSTYYKKPILIVEGEEDICLNSCCR